MNAFEQSGEAGPESRKPSNGDEVEEGNRHPAFRSVTTPMPPEILARCGEVRHLLTQLLCRVQGRKRRGERICITTCLRIGTGIFIERRWMGGNRAMPKAIGSRG